MLPPDKHFASCRSCDGENLSRGECWVREGCRGQQDKDEYSRCTRRWESGTLSYSVKINKYKQGNNKANVENAHRTTDSHCFLGLISVELVEGCIYLLCFD